MSQDKINKLIDQDLKSLASRAEKILNLDESSFNRASSKFADKEAFESAGIERITLYLTHESTMLLIKPIKGMFDKWQLNMYASGSLNFSGDKADFKISDIAGERFRFSIVSESLSYWVDLIDEKQAQDLAKFLSIGITPKC